MSYTMEDFQREYVKDHFSQLTLEEQKEILESLPPEQRLAGLSPEQIRQYLDQLTGGRPQRAGRSGRGKRAALAMIAPSPVWVHPGPAVWVSPAR